MEFMAAAHLSSHIHQALTDAGVNSVTGVDTWPGWGDIENVVIHIGHGQRDALPALQSTIHDVIGAVLEGRRHYVEIKLLPARP